MYLGKLACGGVNSLIHQVIEEVILPLVVGWDNY